MEFRNIKLGQLSMDEFITKFTYLLSYFPYIQNEKSKVQWFISNLPILMKEPIEFDNPKTMDVVVRKA